MTAFKLQYLLALTGALALGACNQQEFTGGNSEKTADAKKVSPKKTDKDDEELGKSNEPEDEFEPEDDNDDTDDNDSVNIGTNNDKNDSLVDLLQGLLNPNSGKLTQDNENEVSTAPGRAYRVGDGAAAQTSCAERVTPYGVAGKKYYFEFEVTRDQTEVQLTLGVTCGIDYGDTNFMILQRGATQVVSKVMSKATGGQSLPTQTLNIGKYTLVIESRNGSQEPGATRTDFDDFLVGELKVKANKPIKAGKIGSQ